MNKRKPYRSGFFDKLFGGLADGIMELGDSIMKPFMRASNKLLICIGFVLVRLSGKKGDTD